MPRNSNCAASDRRVPGSMLVFDKLPKAARVALANSDHNWSGEQLYREYKKRNPLVRTAKACAAFIQIQDAKKHRKDAEAGLVCPGQR